MWIAFLTFRLLSSCVPLSPVAATPITLRLQVRSLCFKAYRADGGWDLWRPPSRGLKLDEDCKRGVPGPLPQFICHTVLSNECIGFSHYPSHGRAAYIAEQPASPGAWCVPLFNREYTHCWDFRRDVLSPSWSSERYPEAIQTAYVIVTTSTSLRTKRNCRLKLQTTTGVHSVLQPLQGHSKFLGRSSSFTPCNYQQ